MFGRTPRPGGDVVAAAQRRLAALAQTHQRSDVDPGLPDEGNAPGSARSETGSTPARHVRSRTTDSGTTDSGTTEPKHQVSDGAARGRTELGRLELGRLELGRLELGRWGLSGPQVTVIALCLVIVVVVGAWWALRSVPHTDQVTLSGARATSTATTPETGLASTAPAPPPAGVTADAGAGRLVVDVAGRVRHPGIVELPAGARVVDAIAAAGGTRPGVALTSLNLARLLVDGEQILVGVRSPTWGGQPASSGSTATTTAITPLELNAATAEQLDTLPGIGPVTAQAIVQWRADNGPFTSVNELLEVSGIGDVTLSDIRPYVYV